MPVLWCTPPPPLCFRMNMSYWFQRREVRWAPRGRPQKLRFRMIEKGCVCYKVLMKFPTRQLGISAFPAALNGACFTYSTSSQAPDVFRFSQSNKWSIVFVIIGPATALKRQAQRHENEQKRRVFHGGVIMGATPASADLRINLWTGGVPSHLVHSVNMLMWCMAACSVGRKEDKFSHGVV